LGTPKKVHRGATTPNNISKKDDGNDFHVAAQQSGTKRYSLNYSSFLLLLFLYFCCITDVICVQVEQQFFRITFKQYYVFLCVKYYHAVWKHKKLLPVVMPIISM